MTNRSLVDEASNPETPFKRLLQLSWGKSVKVRRALLDNPSIAVDGDGEVTNKILAKLADEFPDKVVMSPAFALFGLELKDPAMSEVARIVAKNTKDPHVLALILHEFREDVDVRRSVAENENTPEDVLRLLGNLRTEPSESVRRGVAWNHKTPKDVLRLLGNVETEPDELVRRNVAWNSSTPEDVLRILGDEDTEPDGSVQDAANESMWERGLL